MLIPSFPRKQNMEERTVETTKGLSLVFLSSSLK